MNKEIFAGARRKLAGLLIGDMTALYVAKADHERLKESQFMEVPDETLGAMFRNFWAIVCREMQSDGDKDGFPFKAKMRASCVLYLASEMRKTNAITADYTVSGSIDGGRTSGVWAVRVEAAPDDMADDDDDAPRETWVDGKLTSIRVTTTNPGFDDWRAMREAERSRKDQPHD